MQIDIDRMQPEVITLRPCSTSRNFWYIQNVFQINPGFKMCLLNNMSPICVFTMVGIAPVSVDHPLVIVASYLWSTQGKKPHIVIGRTLIYFQSIFIKILGFSNKTKKHMNWPRLFACTIHGGVAIVNTDFCCSFSLSFFYIHCFPHQQFTIY